MKISLDDLEAKAMAVNCPETWDSGDFACGLEKHDADYIDAITPMTLLALIRVVRAAKAYHDFPHYGTEREFKEALKGISE